MPFIPHTPESLIRRSDSKDPATTCKGITAVGRPCRRPLGVSPQASPVANRESRNGVVAVLEAEDDEHDGAAAFFCWQHQDQAQTLANSNLDGRTANIVPVQQRTSIDTLVDRLGILEVDEVETPSKKPRNRQQVRPARKDTLPRNWQDMDGPLLAVNGRIPRTSDMPSGAKKVKGRSNLGLFCCIRSTDIEPEPSRRVQSNGKKTGQRHHETSNLPASRQSLRGEAPRVHQTPAPANVVTKGSAQAYSSRTDRSKRPSLLQDPPSETENYLSLIPKTSSPQTTAALLAELAKPPTEHDEEGFIYMFWMTDDSTIKPDAQTASSLLLDTTPFTPNGRRKSDFIKSHATSGAIERTSADPTILLKIGRASNVHRRMNQWARQCGYTPSLIRFYPHPSTLDLGMSSPPQSPNSLLKVPYVHKVERLIHLELVGQRVKRNCNCGKEHQEWFEVTSTREGLKKVDEVIKRWVSWGQRVPKKQ